MTTKRGLLLSVTITKKNYNPRDHLLFQISILGEFFIGSNASNDFRPLHKILSNIWHYVFIQNACSPDFTFIHIENVIKMYRQVLVKSKLVNLPCISFSQLSSSLHWCILDFLSCFFMYWSILSYLKCKLHLSSSQYRFPLFFSANLFTFLERQNTCLTLSNTKRGTDLGTLVVPFNQTFHPLHIFRSIYFVSILHKK